jgi:hypothetical protein
MEASRGNQRTSDSRVEDDGDSSVEYGKLKSLQDKGFRIISTSNSRVEDDGGSKPEHGKLKPSLGKGSGTIVTSDRQVEEDANLL